MAVHQKLSPFHYCPPGLVPYLRWSTVSPVVEPGEDLQYWHEPRADLCTAIEGYYQAGKKQVVNFLQQFGYRWRNGVIEPLSQTL